MTDAILTVGQLTRSVKNALEGSFPFVWVRGQVSNCSRPSSGHMYFSLKDEDAILNCVWFRNQQDAESFDPLTGEVFEGGPRESFARRMENGQDVICAGKLTVYAPRGSYQLVVELAQDAGLGRLQLEFERIKGDLLRKGYFDQGRKRPMPRNPVRVAVVTAVTGAAIRDFVRIGTERGTGAEIRIYPALVQGNEAPEQIARAMRLAGEDGWAEIVVLIRGGGSLEDLWAFNTEMVAEAVFACPLPVLAGIGHEVDVSIADLVADVRAATPSHAAQILWPEKRELAQRVDDMETRLIRAWTNGFAWRERSLEALVKSLRLLSPQKTVARWEERLASLERGLERAVSDCIEARANTLLQLSAALPRAIRARLTETEHRLDRLEIRLGLLDPMAPLERGYALAKTAKGGFVRSVADVTPGEKLDLVVRDGMLPVRVEENTGTPEKKL